MSLCEVSRHRASMTDEEFWADVFPQADEPDEDDLRDLSAVHGVPCTECGEIGACAYDSEGRALIHTSPADDGEALS